MFLEEDKEISIDQYKELESQIPLPPLTHWENKCICCNFQLNYIPATGEHYLNHWRIEYGFPIAVEFVIISSYIVAMFVHRPVVSFYNSYLDFFLTLFMILFSYSHIATILVGPGYLPFYYPLKLSQGPIRPDYLSGLITREEQLTFSKNQHFPSRTRFFNSAHRYVIRPDHLCKWVSSFVGKKNHKLFVLFNFWGVVYISLFCYSCIRTIYETITVFSTDQVFFFIIVFLYTALGFSFLFLTGNFLQQNIRQITLNRTQFEIMKDMPELLHRKYPCYKNWEEVFGSIRKWYLWLIPIPAFQGFDDYTLAIIKTSNDNEL